MELKIIKEIGGVKVEKVSNIDKKKTKKKADKKQIEGNLLSKVEHGVGIISRKRFKYVLEEGKKSSILLDVMIANLRPSFFKKPAIKGVFATLKAPHNKNESLTKRERINLLGQNLKMFTNSDNGYQVHALGLLGFPIKVVLWGLDKMALGDKSLWALLVTSRLSKLAYPGHRDTRTGNKVPVCVLPAEDASYEITVEFDGFDIKFDVSVSKAPWNITSDYFAGDAHVHTDYSWTAPGIHIPNGPLIETRGYQALAKGLKWLFITDYSTQFFSSYAKGGIKHNESKEHPPDEEKKNLNNSHGKYFDEEPGIIRPRKLVVWNDRTQEIKQANKDLEETLGGAANNIEKDGCNQVLIFRGEEVPSDTDSHTLVLGRKNENYKLWSQAERIRCEQPDTFLWSNLGSLLGFLFKKTPQKSYGHDNPVDDNVMQICEYEGYCKHPYCYREKDLVIPSHYKHKPIMVAAHPLIDSYPHVSFELMPTPHGIRPKGKSHARGGNLIGFEIFEEPPPEVKKANLEILLQRCMPARLAKREVLAIWNMYLWEEFEETAKTHKFLVALANSDAHLQTISGNNKFGLTKTYAHIPKSERLKYDREDKLSFGAIINALISGHCTCASTGDFGTALLFGQYHPGSFVDVKNGTDLVFEIHHMSGFNKRIYYKTVLHILHNPCTDPSITDKDKFLEYAVNRYTLNSKIYTPDNNDHHHIISIPSNDFMYPGITKDTYRVIDRCNMTCYVAEIVFKDEYGDTSVYCNPIFVKMHDDLTKPHIQCKFD
jgi:hypothetical protein